MKAALLPVLVILLPALSACGGEDAQRSGSSESAGGSGTGTNNGTGGHSTGSGGVDGNNNGNGNGSGGTGTNNGTGGSEPGSGGTNSGDDPCTPDPSAGLTVVGDVVEDGATCLTWMRGSISSDDAKDFVDDAYPGATMADAAAACEALELGGYSDWRLPTLGELSTIATRCWQWGEPPPPWAEEFDVTDAVWSSTPASDGKYCVVDASAGGTPSGSQSSGPGVRCVRGVGVAPAPTECSAQSIPSCP